MPELRLDSSSCLIIVQCNRVEHAGGRETNSRNDFKSGTQHFNKNKKLLTGKEKKLMKKKKKTYAYRLSK